MGKVKGKHVFVIALILSAMLLQGCTVMRKPITPYAGFSVSDLDRNDYNIKRVSGSSGTWYFLIFPLRFQIESCTGVLSPMRYWFSFDILEKEALYDAMEYSGVDVMLPYTKISKVKGIPLLIWHREVTVRGKGLELLSD